MKIYKIDYSKLIKRGEAGYDAEQKQAKEYLDTVPVGNFTVEIKNKQYMKDVLRMINMGDENNEKILVDIDNEDTKHVAVTVYFTISNYATHITVSYKHCEAESDYELANKILDYIKEKV